jgi:hypothetical protein
MSLVFSRQLFEVTSIINRQARQEISKSHGLQLANLMLLAVQFLASKALCQRTACFHLSSSAKLKSRSVAE